MDWQRTCLAVVPCFNEAATVNTVVSAVRSFLPQVLVVDDGSSDTTSAEGSRAGASVLRLSWNQGKGAAVRAGLSKAYAEGFGWALLMDGDGQHDPRDIPTLLTEAEHSTAALIVGNRMPSANQMPWVRRQANRWMSRWISARAGQVLPDTQCGFRLINLAAWAVLTLKTNRFEIESEMLLAFVRGGFSVRFVTIRTIGRGPTSHIQPLEDTLRWFRWWWTAASPQSNPSSRPETAEASAQ